MDRTGLEMVERNGGGDGGAAGVDCCAAGGGHFGRRAPDEIPVGARLRGEEGVQ